MNGPKKAVLALSDGSAYFGKGLGAECTKEGELVFNTGMTGYMEALTDPSYAGQILLMTYPMIGNYGISKEWGESAKVHVEGFCVRRDYGTPHHVQSRLNLDGYLQDNGVGCITDVDTRAITRKVRDCGVMPAALCVYSQEEPDVQELVAKAKKLDYSKMDFVEKVSGKEVVKYKATRGGRKRHVVLLDCGVKMSIVRELGARGIDVTSVNAFSSADDVLSFSPDGIVASNGPGDPALLGKICDELGKLLDYPMMGICLGHQLLGQVAGAKTYKLKFGHRGGNHPVMEMESGKVAITTQNHGFAVDEKGLGREWEMTHANLNDRTCEGLRHKSLPIFSIQYHPEAHPGPRDSTDLFDKFVKTL